MNTYQKPTILYEGKYTIDDLTKFREQNPIWSEHNIYENQLRELFEITYPHLRLSPVYQAKLSKFIIEKTKVGKNLSGNWIYFPWSGIFLHTVTKEEYYFLKTNRNKNIITDTEQKKLLDFTPGVVGLSVGNNIAMSLAHSGIGRKMKLAEGDVLETTNLNRVRVGIDEVGFSKIEIVARQIYEINPYADLDLYTNGLNDKNLEEFINKDPVPDLIFEVIDDFKMKIRLRLAARKAKIPVIMLTNLGDNLLIDVERYDLDKGMSLFNGLVGDIPQEILLRSITEEDKKEYAVQLVGISNIPKKVLHSVRQINKTLIGRPQLMSTANVAAGVATYLARRIALGNKVISGRKLAKFSDVFCLA